MSYIDKPSGTTVQLQASVFIGCALPRAIAETSLRLLLSNGGVRERARAVSTARWKTTLSAVVAATLQLSLASPKAIACSCAPLPPACQAYGQSPMVFLGTVTEALATTDRRVTRARMRIDHAYKGVSEKSLVLFDDGMCDGPNLEVGEQYLMYTRRLGSGDVPSRGCTRSRHVKYAKEDLAYLGGLSEAVPVGTVLGKVVIRTNDYYGDDRPVSGAVVELSGPTRTHTTMTDAEGRYQFANVEPATYSVTADHPGTRMLSFAFDGAAPSTAVEARGCAVVNMVMRKTWRGAVEGRVIRSNGAPGPSGMDLKLIRMENRDGKERSNVLFSHGGTTNDQGEYSFDEVAPGRYKVVMNLYRFPTPQAPYPTLYWPSARTESDALFIEVVDSHTEQRFDFRLPPEPESTIVNGIVLTADGSPAPEAQVFIEVLPDNSIAGDDENRPRTDAAGHFSFTALAGFEYRLRATIDGNRRLHSPDANFSLKTESRFITILVDRPGRFDNDPVERMQKRLAK